MNANDLTGTWFLGEAYAVGPGSACTTSTAHGRRASFTTATTGA